MIPFHSDWGLVHINTVASSNDNNTSRVPDLHEMAHIQYNIMTGSICRRPTEVRTVQSHRCVQDQPHRMSLRYVLYVQFFVYMHYRLVKTAFIHTDMLSKEACERPLDDLIFISLAEFVIFPSHASPSSQQYSCPSCSDAANVA